MNKIYTIKVEDDVPLSLEFSNNIRTICYLLYDEVSRLETEDDHILYTHDGITYNELFEEASINGYVYEFLSEKNMDNEILYEPFLIDENSFGLSVHNNITESEIVSLLNEIQMLLKTNYHFVIDSYLFETAHDRIKIIKSMQKKHHTKIKINHNLFDIRKRVND